MIAEVAGLPIGFLQIIDPAREENHYLGERASDLRAIDIWIGKEAYIGRGFGKKMEEVVVRLCFADRMVSATLIDSIAPNKKARSFCKELGFHLVEYRHFSIVGDVAYRLERSVWMKRLLITKICRIFKKLLSAKTFEAN